MCCKWALPYSRLSPGSTEPPPFCASHCAPKHTPSTGHWLRTPSRSRAGASASLTLCGLPDRIIPFHWRPCGSSPGGVSSSFRQSPFHGLISANVLSSRTLRAISWVYWDPKSRMRMLSMPICVPGKIKGDTLPLELNACAEWVLFCTTHARFQPGPPRFPIRPPLTACPGRSSVGSGQRIPATQTTARHVGHSF